jgi:hypothetical protein
MTKRVTKMVSEVLIPRPYGIVGMIGDMIRAVEIALLKESLGVIMSEGSRAISKGLAGGRAGASVTGQSAHA